MSIKTAGRTIVGPGNEIYIGRNGNFFSGKKDLGVRAIANTTIMSQSEFDAAYKKGLYYVIDSSQSSDEPVIQLWYITDTGNKIAVSGNGYVIPEIGENGNWFIDGTDTGKSAIAQKTITTIMLYAENWEPVDGVDGLYAQNIVYEDMYQNYDVDIRLGDCEEADLLAYVEQFNKIISWEAMDGYIKIFSNASDHITIPVDIVIAGSADATPITGGAQIDDESVNTTTAWSSHKIVDYTEEFKATVESMAAAKNLEFQWSGTRLGVRQQGYQDYLFKDLRGPVGLCGIDGSSIVEAELDDNGHLWVTIQDDEAEIDTAKMLTLESGAFTCQDLLDLQNSINRINNDLAAIKTGPFREVIKVSEITDGNSYQHIVTLGGCGTIQFFTTKFTGKVRITVDSHIYEGEFVDLSVQSTNNLLLAAIDDNSVIMNANFAADQSIPLNITFEKSCKLEMIVTENSEGLLPTILVQGDYYYNSEYGEDSSEVISPDILTDEDIDGILDSVFGEEEELTDEDIDGILDDVFTDETTE